MSTKKKITLAGLFTCATQTGYDVFHVLRNHKRLQHYSIELVQTGDTSCSDCDILVCTSYQAMLAVKQYLNSEMIVIVCDGPLILACLDTATPLDYIRRVSYKFEFHKIDYRPVLQVLRGKSPQIILQATDYDVIGIVTENSMSGGLILTELNKVQSYFDALTRNRLRFLFIQLFDCDDYKPAALELQAFLKKECTNPTHKTEASNLLHKLFKKRALKQLRAALAEIEAGKNVASVAKRHDISQFELNYLRKMFKNIDTAAARTENYAIRIKGLEAAV